MCDDLSSPGPSDDLRGAEDAADRDLPSAGPDQDASGLTNDELWDALRAQAGHLAAGEARFLDLLGVFDAREAWGAYGIVSSAHWLNWSVGTSLGAAREQVRVARALRRLPALAAAFGAGEISYSKVRAITRVANPLLEAPLLELARQMTASQLERTVSYYRRADPAEGRTALARREGRYLRSHTDDEGMVRLSGRLAPEDAAVVLAAIEMARRALAEDAHQAGSDVSAETPGDHPAAADQGAEPAEHEPTDADPDVSAETSPEPGCVGPAEDWGHSRADALVALCGQILARGMAEDPGAPAVRVMVHVDEAVLEDPAREGCSHIEGIGAIAAHTAARLACEAAVSRVRFRPGAAVEPEGATRQVPETIRRAVLARDRGCRFPGCERRAYLHLHHVRFVSQGGPTRASNLAAVCSAHHRLVHEGGFRLSMSEEGSVRVWAPDGREVPPAGLAKAPRGLDLWAAHAAAGLSIDETTLSYNGERCDYADTISALLCISGHLYGVPEDEPGKEASGGEPPVPDQDEDGDEDPGR